MRFALACGALVLVAACGSRVLEGPEEEGGATGGNATQTGSASGPVSATSGPASNSTSAPTASTTGTASTMTPSGPSSFSSTAASDDTGSSTSGPTTPPDLPEYCQLDGEECPDGYKCAPYNDGPGHPNARRCVPIDPNAVGLGEECEQELDDQGGWTGIDNCGDDAVCWDFNEDAPGTCKALCESDFLCDDPETRPHAPCQECFCVCESPCDVLGQDCEESWMCVVSGDISTCTPDASGDAGAFGDPCEYVNACDPGLLCVTSTAVPDCDGSLGCCTPYCDTSAPDCPAGTHCDPLYPDGGAPTLLDNVGMCIL